MITATLLLSACTVLVRLRLVESVHQAPSTSYGSLAAGAESLDSNLETLSTQATQATATRDSMLATGSQFFSRAYTSLLYSEIMERQDELAQAREDAEQARTELAAAQCSGLGTCGDCAGAAGCVWCSGERVCVSGDERGPMAAQCTDFRTTCGCEDMTSCGDCRSLWECEWCQSDGLCTESFQNCDQWLAEECPAPPSQSATAQSPATEALERQLADSESAVASLQEELRLLQAQLEATLRAESPESVDYPSSTVRSVQGLADSVDGYSQAQRNGHTESQELSSLASIALTVSAEVSSLSLNTLTGMVTQSETEQGQFYDTLLRQSNADRTQANEQRQRIQDQTTANSALQAENSSLQESAASLQAQAAAVQTAPAGSSPTSADSSPTPAGSSPAATEGADATTETQAAAAGDGPAADTGSAGEATGDNADATATEPTDTAVPAVEAPPTVAEPSADTGEATPTETEEPDAASDSQTATSFLQDWRV